jgi:hypothetical protein
MKKPKIFLGLFEIAGYYQNLQKGLKELGYTADFYTFKEHIFSYSHTQNYNIIFKLIKAIELYKLHLTKYSWLPGFVSINIDLLHKSLIKYFFYFCLYRYDVFILGYNSKFKDQIGYNHPKFKDFDELALLKKYKKKVIYIYHGSDSRPPYMDGSLMGKSTGRNLLDCYELTIQAKNKIEEIEAHADYIINAKTTGQFHNRPFIEFLKIGIPYSFEHSRLKFFPRPPGDEVRILHSPSNPEAKGSNIIIDTVNKLRSDGVNVSLKCIINQPNDVVIQNIIQSDIIIDQLYSDTPMAGFATEAAFFGKPVIVCGYYSRYMKSSLLPEEIPPTVYVSPDLLEENIMKLVSDKALRISMGQELKKFVESRWSLVEVARRFQKIIDNEIPEDWWVSPKSITYWEGCCIDRDRAKELIKDLCNTYGDGALNLDNNPNLKDILIRINQEQVKI